MEKLYYTIGEAADILGESTSLVRFWSNSFPKYIKPKRNAKGNRLFTAEDLDPRRGGEEDGWRQEDRGRACEGS